MKRWPRSLHFLTACNHTVRNFRRGVSLHGHTQHSRESLGFIEHYIDAVPVVAQITRHALARYQRDHGKELDFNRAFWTAPLTAGEVHDLVARMDGAVWPRVLSPRRSQSSASQGPGIDRAVARLYRFPGRGPASGAAERMSWSRNTATTCLCTGRRRFTPGKVWNWSGPRWRTGWVVRARCWHLGGGATPSRDECQQVARR